MSQDEGTKQEEIQQEVHEHPDLNGVYPTPVWVKTWASTGTNDEAPEDAPIQCAICGKVKGG